MREKKGIFFIIGCARSGTTSLCKILDTATNGVCLMEPDPKLDVEARELMEGRLSDPQLVVDKIAPRIEAVHKQGLIYGEKNVTLPSLISVLNENFDCKFIYIYRDGRDVVMSLCNWHEQLFGNIYRECKDIGNCSEIAFQNASNTPLPDLADYARPRPQKGTPFYNEWMELSRLDMCAWYWAYVNKHILSELGKLSKGRWMSIDYTSPSLDDIIKAADFVGLEGFDHKNLTEMLNRRINSLESREETSSVNFVRRTWQEYPKEMQDKFDRIAGDCMNALGFY